MQSTQSSHPEDRLPPSLYSRAVGALSLNDVTEFRRNLDAETQLRLAETVLSKYNPAQAFACNDYKDKQSTVFNLRLKGVDDKGTFPVPLRNQGNSGLCWAFASLESLSYRPAQETRNPDFELSSRYLGYYCLLEKANVRMQHILDLRNEPFNSRDLMELTSTSSTDGGWWETAVSLLDKYGIVPSSIYPDSPNSRNPNTTTRLLTELVDEYASNLRETALAAATQSLCDDTAKRDGDGEGSIQKCKKEYMESVYRLLAATMGQPPAVDKGFKWDYSDKDGNAQVWEGTPREFYDFCKGVDVGMDSRVMFSSKTINLMHDTRKDFKTVNLFERTEHVAGGRNRLRVNVPMEDIERSVVDCLRSDFPVYFICNASYSVNTKLQQWDAKPLLWKLCEAFKIKSGSWRRKDRLDMCHDIAHHAMVITGAQVEKKEDGEEVMRYKVLDSSYSEDRDKRFFLMPGDWFRKHVSQVTIPWKAAKPELVKLLCEQEPTIWGIWDNC